MRISTTLRSTTPLGAVGSAADAHALVQPCVRDGNLMPVFSIVQVTHLPRVVAYLIPEDLPSLHIVDIVPRVGGLGANIFRNIHRWQYESASFFWRPATLKRQRYLSLRRA